MFSLFEFALPAMSMLPVEMLAMILRCLSSESLFNAALANRHFMKVCRGDPILRERIRLEIKKELQLQAILDAKRGIVVLRHDPPQIFNPNVQKTVVREKVKSSKVHICSGPKVPEARPFAIIHQAERTRGGGKLRRRRKERAEPYKNFRC